MRNGRPLPARWGYVLKNDVVDTLRMALRNAFKGKRTFRDEIGNF